MAPLEGAGETASSTWDQGRALSTENEAGTRGILDSTGQDSSEDARRSWHDEVRPDSFVEAEVPSTAVVNMSGKHVCLHSGCGAGRPLAATAR